MCRRRAWVVDLEKPIIDGKDYFMTHCIDLSKFMKDDLDDEILVTDIHKSSIGTIKNRKFNGRVTFNEELVQFCYNNQAMVFNIQDLDNI